MENFFDVNVVSLSISDFVIQITVSLILSLFLSQLYKKYSFSLSNKAQFSNNLIAICLITTLVISIVKSSLALSLGLVGALSIVRFRTAIKDPEDLSYLFFAIAIGLGTGSGLIEITIIAFFIISITFILLSNIKKKREYDLYLNVTYLRKDEFDINIEKFFEENLIDYKIKRLDISENKVEYIIELRHLDNSQIKVIKERVNTINKNISISFFEDVI